MARNWKQFDNVGRIVGIAPDEDEPYQATTAQNSPQRGEDAALRLQSQWRNSKRCLLALSKRREIA